VAVVHWQVEVVDVSFVHGHARDAGWVVAHRRSPTEPEDGQLPLLAAPPAAEAGEPALPRPRVSPETTDDDAEAPTLF